MNFETLKNKYINLIEQFNFENFEEKIEVHCPLRVNLSAGWNDTPPYCNELEGYTLNASILLNNQYPVHATIRKLDVKKIILRNLDIHKNIEITYMNELLECDSPEKPFALSKASILASGLIPYDTNFDLSTFFDKYGGFELSTNVKDIPVGSGLGTSSVLIFTCIKAIHLFCKHIISNEDLFHMTACAEQIMTTGGGYQDQIGACDSGFKLIHFEPGFYPKINCEHIQLSSTIQQELNNRFVFIYTGKTRVAKNLLSHIMSNYMNNDKQTLSTLKDIGIVSKKMRNNLINDDLKAFGINMIKSFELNIDLNPDFSNKEINSIINFASNFIDGYMLSGAGNGGFLTLLLKPDIDKQTFMNSFNSNFEGSDFNFFNFEFLF